MVATDFGRGPKGPGLDGQGGCAISLAVDWPARPAAYGGNGPPLAFSQRIILGGERHRLCGASFERKRMEAAGPNLLEDRARRLGHIRMVCHLPHAARTQWLLPLQRTAAIGIFQHGLRDGTPGHPERTVSVASADEPISLVSKIAGQSPDRALAAFSRDARFPRVSDLPCGSGRHHWIWAQHESYRAGHGQHPPARMDSW